MSEACPKNDPLVPAPHIPVPAERQPGVVVYTGTDGHIVQVDRRVAAAELTRHLALLVPAAARLTSATVDADGELEMLFIAPDSLPQQ